MFSVCYHDSNFPESEGGKPFRRDGLSLLQGDPFSGFIPGTYTRTIFIYMKVLIVEDEVIIALSLRKDLQRDGHDVCGIVGSGEEAIRVAGEERPELILMDINLDGAMNGLEAAGRIREFLRCQIIYLTGYSDNEVIKKGLVDEGARFLQKPIDSSELNEQITELSGA